MGYIWLTIDNFRVTGSQEKQINNSKMIIKGISIYMGPMWLLITNNNIGCINIHRTNVSANNSINNNIIVLDLKKVYYNNY